MSLEAAIYARTQAAGAVTALVGTRVYPGLLPHGTAPPAITFQRVSARRMSAMGSDTGTVSARVQLDCWGASYDGARALGEAVRGAFQRWKGTAGGTTVSDTMLDSEAELYDDAAQLHRVALDFTFHYAE